MFSKPSFIISFQHEISVNFICCYAIDLKFHLEVKSETKIIQQLSELRNNICSEEIIFEEEFNG